MGVQDIVRTGRRLVETTLLDTCAIMDRVSVADDSGGSTETYVVRDQEYPCRFVDLSDKAGPRLANLREASGSLNSFATVTLVLSTDVDDVVEHCKVWTPDGRAFLVVGNETPPSNLATSTRLWLRELGAGGG